MTLRPVLPTIGLLAALVLIGLGAALLAATSLSSYVGHAPPVAGVPADPPAARSGLSERVVLVVVDGLRYDASLHMPFLNELRGRGAEFIAEVSPPSISFPGWTALATGAGPEASGVTTNWHEGPVLVDSLFASVRRAGKSTGVVGDPGWSDLFPGLIGLGVYTYQPGESPSAARSIPAAGNQLDVAANLASDAAVVRAAVSVLKGEAGARPSFLVVHVLGVDEIGHAYGGRSEAYDEAAANVDTLLRELAASIDLTRETLVVTSDHGHTDRGGHGGAEPEVLRTPLVLVGSGVNRPRTAGRAPPVVRQADVAPTLAMLVGAGIPAESEGRPLFAALSLDATGRAQRGVDALLARRDNALRYSDALGVPPPATDLGLSARNAIQGRFYTQAAADADVGLDQLDTWTAGAREERLGSDQVSRLPIGVLLLAVPALAALVLRPRRETLLGLSFAVVYTGAYWLVFVWRGYGPSLSSLDRAGSTQRFVAEGFLASVLIALAVSAIVALAYHPSGILSTLRLVARFLLWAATILVWQVAVFLVVYGPAFRLFLPDPTLALVYFVDLLQLAGIGAACVPATGLALALARLASGRPASRAT